MKPTGENVLHKLGNNFESRRALMPHIDIHMHSILTRAHPVVSAEHQRPGGVDFRPPYDLENYAG